MKHGEKSTFQNVCKQFWRNEASFIDITWLWQFSLVRILKASRSGRNSNLVVLFRDWRLQADQLYSQQGRKCTQTLLFSRGGGFFKMVRVCAYPRCFNQEKTLRLRHWASMQEENLTFHTLPLHDPERLNLWLIALHRDTGSPIQSIRGLRVCSKHFSPSDFSVAKGNKRRLSSTAVPKLFVQQRTEVSVEILDKDDFRGARPELFG